LGLPTTYLVPVADVLWVCLAPREDLVSLVADHLHIGGHAPPAESPNVMGGGVVSVSRTDDELSSVRVVGVRSEPDSEHGLMGRTTHGLSDGVSSESLVDLTEEDVLK